jgi:hypothetical protein
MSDGNPPPVDNHPKYSEWIQAMDRLKAAADQLEATSSFPDGHPDRQAARAELWRAQGAYEEVSREIGY